MYEYMHGGNPLAFMNRSGVYVENVTDFSVNTNPFGIPPIVKIRWNELMEGAGGYPSCEGDLVVEFYEERFGVKEENVVAGNGSTELIYLTPSALNIKNAVIFEPSFYDYRRAFEAAGCRIHTIGLEEKNGFEINFAGEAAERMKNADAIILGNPNNPTGVLTKKNTIAAIAQKYSDKWILVDEAFMQFSEDFEQNSFIFSRPDNVIVFHSLTKFYALAGLRIGAVIGSKDVVERFKKVKQPWSVNSIAERAAHLLIGCGEYEKSTLRFIISEKKRIEETLSEVKTIQLFKTSANFCLAKLNTEYHFDNFLTYLLKNGIYVRDCRNFKGLKGGFFRFAVLEREKNDRLIELILNYD